MTTKSLGRGVKPIPFKRPPNGKAILMPAQRWVLVSAGLLVFLILPTLLTLSSIGNIHVNQFGPDAYASNPLYSEYLKTILGQVKS